MTDEIARLRDAVVEAAKRITDERPLAHGETVSVTSAGSFVQLKASLAALRAAEEAAKRPRLRSPGEAVWCHLPRHGDLIEGCVLVVQARDAEWIVALDKLQRHSPGAVAEIADGSWTRTADINAIIESTKP